MLLDDIFDPAKGWAFSNETAPVNRGAASDGNTCYFVTVDKIVVTIYAINRWAEGTPATFTDRVPPHRLVVLTKFIGVTITDLRALFLENFQTRGLPCYAIDAGGTLYLEASFPCAPDFPIDLARKQTMVCIGMVAETAKDNLRAWNARGGAKGALAASDLDWRTAKNVAGVAGAFLRAFLEP